MKFKFDMVYDFKEKCWVLNDDNRTHIKEINPSMLQFINDINPEIQEHLILEINNEMPSMFLCGMLLLVNNIGNTINYKSYPENYFEFQKEDLEMFKETPEEIYISRFISTKFKKYKYFNERDVILIGDRELMFPKFYIGRNVSTKNKKGENDYYISFWDNYETLLLAEFESHPTNEKLLEVVNRRIEYDEEMRIKIKEHRSFKNPFFRE